MKVQEFVNHVVKDVHSAKVWLNVQYATKIWIMDKIQVEIVFFVSKEVTYNQIYASLALKTVRNVRVYNVALVMKDTT